METLPRNVWKRLCRLFPADEAGSARAAQLFREYEAEGYLQRPAVEMLRCSLPVVADFFRRVALMHSIESPVLRRRDTRWMSEFDYTMVNVRAAGVDGVSGTFLSAAFYLTTLRTRAIILAPVTRGIGENLAVIDSHAVFREELADRIALDSGIGPELQFAAFCEAAHLLGLALGFELDYRVDSLAAVVLNRPELFFWTRDDRFVADEAVQDELREDVRSLLVSLRKPGEPVDRGACAAALESVKLAARPVGDGSGRTALALRLAHPQGTGEHRDAAVAYWGRVFDLWRDRYGFDFLVLRGTRRTAESDDQVPDRALVHRAADAARKAGVRRNIGVAADGDGFDVENYGVQGVDLVFEDDGDGRADTEWFRRAFALDEKLRRVNLGRKLRFSAPLLVTPGEKDSRPRRERANIKRFVARFLGVGPARRPLVETMGSLDGAWGYRRSIEHAAGMGWVSPNAESATACVIEDVAARYRDMLENGERLDKHLGPKTAWWVIRSRYGLLVAIVSVENEDLLPPDELSIDYSMYLSDGNSAPMTVLEYDFREERGLLRLSADTLIQTGPIPYRSFRLYAIT